MKPATELLLALSRCGSLPNFRGYAEAHRLELFEALLGLCANRPVRIEVDRLLIRFKRPGLHNGSDLIALGFEIHGVDQSDAQQIPGLRALRIERQGLLQ